MDDKEILTSFEREFEDVVKDPQALKFAEQDVDLRLASGEGRGDDYSVYRRAGNAARDYQARQREQSKMSSIVAEMRRARHQE